MQHSTISTQSASHLQLHQRYKFKKKLSLYICTSSRYTAAILCSSVIYMLHLHLYPLSSLLICLTLQ